MKHLYTVIKVIRDCCTRRQELQESQYKQLLDLLPLNEHFEKEINFDNETEVTPNKKKKSELYHYHSKTMTNSPNKIPNSNGEIHKLEKNINLPNSHEKKTKGDKPKSELFNGDLLKKQNEKNYFNKFIQNCNMPTPLNEYKLKQKKTLDIYCAYGELHTVDCKEKHFSLKNIEIIPKNENKESVMKSFLVVCITGNQREFVFSQNNKKGVFKNNAKNLSKWGHNYYTSRNLNNEILKNYQIDETNSDKTNISNNRKRKLYSDDFYFNNYEQFFFIKAYGFKIAGIISGIGKNNINVCDNITFYLLKAILTNMKKVYNNSNFQKWTCDKIEYILLLSVNDINNFLKANYSRNSLHSGCSLSISAYSKIHNILTVLHIGNIQIVLAKNVEEETEETNTNVNTDITYEAVLLTKNHDILNKEEKRRIELFNLANSSSYSGKNICDNRTNTWCHTDNSNDSIKSNENDENINSDFDASETINELCSINVTKAIGLFHFTNFGLSNVPDIIDVKLKKNTKGFLILYSYAISQVYTSDQLIDFLFNQRKKNISLFQLSQKLIYNVHSIYMSTKNKSIKDMALIIIPLTN